MNQVGLKFVTADKNIPGRGKGQAAFRGKGNFDTPVAVHPFAPGLSRGPEKFPAILKIFSGRFPAVVRGEKSVMNAFFLQVRLQPGQGIGHPIQLRHKGIGKVGYPHRFLPGTLHTLYPEPIKDMPKAGKFLVKNRVVQKPQFLNKSA
jgi:hypothetical protein